jgi:hypothetical protein
MLPTVAGDSGDRRQSDQLLHPGSVSSRWALVAIRHCPAGAGSTIAPCQARGQGGQQLPRRGRGRKRHRQDAGVDQLLGLDRGAENRFARALEAGGAS